MDIGPGDWVECINNGTIGVEKGLHTYQRPRLTVRLLTQGSVYRVGNGFAIDNEGEAWICIVGECSRIIAPNPWNIPDGFFRMQRFRPVYRPKSSIIKALQQPSPELTPA